MALRSCWICSELYCPMVNSRTEGSCCLLARAESYVQARYVHSIVQTKLTIAHVPAYCTSILCVL